MEKINIDKLISEMKKKLLFALPLMPGTQKGLTDSTFLRLWFRMVLTD